VYLRVSVTDRCDFRCWYCRPERGASSGGSNPILAPASLLAVLAGIHRAAPLHKVRLTGGEPLLRPDLEDIVAGLRTMLPDADLAITTNGHGLAERASSLRAAGLDRVNISLDSADPGRFREITGRDACDAVKHSFRAAAVAGFDRIKLNAVLLSGGAEPEVEDLVGFAAEAGAEVRFIELMPFGPAAARFTTEFLPMAEALSLLRRNGGYLGPEEATSTARRHRFLRRGREVVVGFIPSVSEPFCASCDRLRLDGRGRLFACLRAEDGRDLAGCLSESPEALAEVVRAFVAEKRRPTDHWPDRSLVGIGG
jgi:cyclic pyranopterin phosphate synthase